MLEFSLMVLVLVVCVGCVVLMALWLNQMATAVNTLAQRVQGLEQRAAAKANDPASKFQSL